MERASQPQISREGTLFLATTMSMEYFQYFIFGNIFLNSKKYYICVSGRLKLSDIDFFRFMNAYKHVICKNN